MKIKSFNILPEEYKEVYKIDMQNNKKLVIGINIGSILLIIPFIVIAVLLKLEFILSFEGLLFLIFALFSIIIIHELIHGIFFKFATKEKLYFKFHGFAASASVPSAYFYKGYFLIIGLAPAVLINLTLLVACFFVNEIYFLGVYFALSVHFSSCIGDFFVAYKLIKYNKETLVCDKGIEMSIFVKKEEIYNVSEE